MTEKLKDYQVLDVFCGGTLYKVKHKVKNNIFAWKAYNCFAFSDEQIQNIDNEVKILSKVLSGNFLRYYDTILHRSTKTLYFVLEYISWQSVQELISLCKATDKYFTEKFIWYSLFELARICKILEELNFVTLKKCFSPESIFVGPNGELRTYCFEITSRDSKCIGLFQQIGEVIRSMCYCPSADDEVKEFKYSDDLRDMITFLTDNRSSNLHPEVVLYHPTVLANTDISEGKHFTDIFVSTKCATFTTIINKCDSEKAVDQCKAIQPFTRSQESVESLIYCNMKPKCGTENNISEHNVSQDSLSPTIAALALELPGFIPRNRKLYSFALEKNNNPQMVSEKILSHQWMSRLIALREREESLNERERDLICKEIIRSPSIEINSLDQSREPNYIKRNGITLPQLLNQVKEETNKWTPHFKLNQRRSCLVHSGPIRNNDSYGGLDSSVSSKNFNSSLMCGAAEITEEYIPQSKKNPEITAQKFTASNSFAESDECIILTYQKIQSDDNQSYQTPKQTEKVLKDITKFKYLDLAKVTSEKRSAIQENYSHPSKQVNITGKVLSDMISNSLRKSPLKTTTSKGLDLQRQCSKCQPNIGYRAEQGHVIEQSNFSTKITLIHTPKIPLEFKKSKRRSLFPFKTPFKFKTSRI